MATLDRRVQVLLSDEQYSRLHAAAKEAGISVGALVREAVTERIAQKETNHRRAWKRIFERADALPAQGPIDWDAEKAAFDRDVLEGDLSMKRAS